MEYSKVFPALRPPLRYKIDYSALLPRGLNSNKSSDRRCYNIALIIAA